MGRIDEVIVPFSRKELFAVRVDRRRYHGLDDVHVIADGRSCEFLGHLFD